MADAPAAGAGSDKGPRRSGIRSLISGIAGGQFLSSTQFFRTLLGFSPTANAEEIKRAYRFLAKAFHPDRLTEPAQEARAEVQFKVIHETYEVLSDPQRRRATMKPLTKFPPTPHFPAGMMELPEGEVSPPVCNRGER